MNNFNLPNKIQKHVYHKIMYDGGQSGTLHNNNNTTNTVQFLKIMKLGKTLDTYYQRTGIPKQRKWVFKFQKKTQETKKAERRSASL